MRGGMEPWGEMWWGIGGEKDVNVVPGGTGGEEGGVADRRVWINLIISGEEQSASVREAPVQSSKLIKDVVMHVCV